MDEITYAKVNGPPDDWYGLRIFDLNSGAEVGEVIEVNTAEGWLVCYAPDDDGVLRVDQATGTAKTKRIEGRFEIRRPT